MASREVIEQVSQASDIVDVIGEYFPLQRAGTSYKALSPFTNEKTPSFYVNPAKQFFYCFSSQQGGDVFKFVQLYENISFGEALKKLADRAQIQIKEELSAEELAEQRLLRQMREAYRLTADWYHHLLIKSPSAEDARAYLKGRGIGIETAKEWKLGYAPQASREFEHWAQQQGLKDFILLKSGLLRRSEDGRGNYAFFRHRLMFPITNDYGDTIAFSGRVLSKDQKGGKYVNSPETPLFQKSKTFFGLSKSKRAILNAGSAILCEGQLDMISAFEHGVENIVAPLGTAFTEAHARLLRRHTEEVIICYDADRAGIKATNEAFAHLAKAGVVVRVARMPEGDDPDSFIRRDGTDAFRKVINEAEEYFDFQIRLGTQSTGDTIRDKAQLANRLGEKVALMEDPLKQKLLIDKLASRLGMPPTEIARIVKTAQRDQTRIQNREQREDGSPQAVSQVSLMPRWNVMKNLCRLLLTSNEARQFLQTEGDPAVLDYVADSELLGHLWKGDVDTENPASIGGFLSSLPEPVQSAGSRLLVESGEGDDAELAKDCYQAILRKSLENQLHQTKSRMNEILEKLKTSGLKEDAKSKLLAELTPVLSDYQALEQRIKELPPPRVKSDEAPVFAEEVEPD